MPQGQVVDTTVTAVAHRDWREHFATRLQGRGLELGPLHRPIPTHDGMRMTYVDYQDQATLQLVRQYGPQSLQVRILVAANLAGAEYATTQIYFVATPQRINGYDETAYTATAVDLATGAVTPLLDAGHCFCADPSKASRFVMLSGASSR